MLTVLLSAYNETRNPFFWRTLESIKNLQNQGFSIRPIVGATPGSDDTLSLLERSKIDFIEIHTKKRAERYNRAFELATSNDTDWIILNHPRSVLEQDAFLSLRGLPVDLKWGAFTHQFDIQHPLLSFTSWWSNHVRGDIKHIYYLDHCVFVRKQLFEKVGGFPSLEIFEDTVLSQNLARICMPVRLPWRSTTSAIRFQSNGVWGQSLHNQVLKFRFLTNGRDTLMNEEYEKGLNLNSE
jgi:hypothetical protein